MANVGTAAIGKVLQGGGVGQSPSFSTATYPSVATGTGKILRADGTNWVPTTATYPATAGTAGNVLTSDGTNFVSSPLLLLSLSGQLTSAQIKALHGTPIQIIPTPGMGKTVLIYYAYSDFVYGGSNVFVAGAFQTISIAYGTTHSLYNLVSNTNLTGTTTTSVGASPTLTQTTSFIDNQAINLVNTSATEITGNAANDNVVNWTILYTITSD